MFSNPGEKLKNIARVLFVLSVVGAIILAFAVGIVEEEMGYYYTYTETVFYAGRFFGIMIGVPLVSYVQCLCLYGFGELIENTTPKQNNDKNEINSDISQRNTLNDIESNLPQL